MAWFLIKHKGKFTFIFTFIIPYAPGIQSQFGSNYYPWKLLH